jgi:hypothetical protein
MTKTLAWLVSAVTLFGLIAVPVVHARASDTQTILFIRHGEKPPRGLGQLDCQGLNRALALPPVIARLAGHPDALFAPSPAEQKKDDGQDYDYIRPLATIEPTAILLEMPVNTSFGVSDIAGLRTALERPAYRHATLVVAWEHVEIERLAREMITAHGGDGVIVPKWDGQDFDSVYVVRLAWTGDNAVATFERKHEGLNGQRKTCPK